MTPLWPLGMKGSSALLVHSCKSSLTKEKMLSMIESSNSIIYLGPNPMLSTVRSACIVRINGLFIFDIDKDLTESSHEIIKSELNNMDRTSFSACAGQLSIYLIRDNTGNYYWYDGLPFVDGFY